MMHSALTGIILNALLSWFNSGDSVDAISGPYRNEPRHFYEETIDGIRYYCFNESKYQKCRAMISLP